MGRYQNESNMRSRFSTLLQTMLVLPIKPCAPTPCMLNTLSTLYLIYCVSLNFFLYDGWWVIMTGLEGSAVGQRCVVIPRGRHLLAIQATNPLFKRSCGDLI